MRLPVTFLVSSLPLIVLGVLAPFKAEAQSSKLSQIYQSPARSFSNQSEEQPNAWRGIIPLHSTRADVERLLGNHKWSHGATFIYESESERVDVVYSKGVCKLSGVERWRVPEDVVIKLEVASRSNMFVRDLKLDPRRYIRQEESHPENWVEYRSVDDGIRVKAMLDGKEEKILLIIYEPGTKDKRLQCPSN
jgi:hypothetical protein